MADLEKLSNEDKVPIDKVLDDMYNPNSAVSSSARDYYYLNYATEEEREEMNAEDRHINIICGVAVAVYVLVLGYGLFSIFLK